MTVAWLSAYKYKHEFIEYKCMCVSEVVMMIRDHFSKQKLRFSIGEAIIQDVKDKCTSLNACRNREL